MELLLGIFNTKAYQDAKDSNPIWDHYFKLIPDHAPGAIIDQVDEMLEVADKVHFMLDGVRLPIDTIHSITCEELSLVINNPKYLQKTTFYIFNLPLDTDGVVHLIIESTKDPETPLYFLSLLKRKKWNTMYSNVLGHSEPVNQPVTNAKT